MRRWVWPIADANRALKAAIRGSVAKAASATLRYEAFEARHCVRRLSPATLGVHLRDLFAMNRNKQRERVLTSATNTSRATRQSRLDKQRFFLIGARTGFLRDRNATRSRARLDIGVGVIPSGSIPIEIRRGPGRSHRPGVRPWYAFARAGPLGGKGKSHCSRNGVRLQCDLMPKAPPETRDFDWKGTVQADYLGVPLLHFGETHGTRRPRARCWLRPHEIRFECGRKRGQVRTLPIGRLSDRKR